VQFLFHNFWSQQSWNRQAFQNNAICCFKINFLISILLGIRAGNTPNISCQGFCRFKCDVMGVLNMSENFTTELEFLLLIYPEK
jgi:fumarate reductase subunit C